MKKRGLLLSLLVFLLMSGPASGVNLGGLNFADNAFADAVISSYGDFFTSGGALSQVLIDKDPATYAASWTAGAYVQLGFTDNVIMNGPGADLALFELGRPDTFKVSLTMGGTSILYPAQNSGYYAGPFLLNIAMVNLDDFGIPAGAPVSQIVVGLDTLTTSVPSLSLAGALNSAAPPGPSNQPPAANPGLDQTTHVGRQVTLDGSGSCDPDGNVPISYSWEIIEKPGGSEAALSNLTTVNPTFVPDVDGGYKVQLIVTDSVGLASTPAIVTVSTTNSPPVAAAGPDQSINSIGALVQLDGSQSFDADGDSLTYEWTFISQPAGSNATLNTENPQKPTFVADVHGEYKVQLVVKDSWTASQPAAVTISFLNVPPQANPGNSQSVLAGTLVSLDGNGSSDANGDSLTYTWALGSLPVGSFATLDNPASAAPTFVPDLPGTYVAQLVVNDGFVDSDPRTVQIEVVTLATETIRDIQNFVQAKIMELGHEAFLNANMKNTLLNKLNRVISNIEGGKFQDALEQLKNDILPKTDGCASARVPDKNDWIQDPEAQEFIYPFLLKIIAELEQLT